MLEIIVLTFFISLVLNIVLKRFGLPTIIGYIATGTIIAYLFGLHHSASNHDLKLIAEYGIVFLMFTIGLEFSIEHLKKIKYEVFVVGHLQIIITSIVSYLIAYYIFELQQILSIVLAISISLSSTAIVLKSISESGEIYKRHGQVTLGILIMQDIVVIPILILLGFLSSSESTSLLEILMKTTANALFLLGVMYIIGKYLLEPFFTEITKTKSDELFVIAILFLAVGSSYLAHQFGFSYSLGALIAGMMISETKFKHQAEADLIPFRDILLGIFFITVGMQIEFGIISKYILEIVALLIGIMVLKFAILYLVVRIRDRERTSFKVALSLIQIGEFSLAILELAKSNGLVGEPYGQVMIVTIVISMIITPLILKNLSSITNMKSGDEVSETSVSKLENHIVVLGYGEFGATVSKNLKTKNYKIVENNIYSYQKGKDKGEPIIFGDAMNRQILQHIAVSKASHIIVAVENPIKLRAISEILIDTVDVSKIIIRLHSEQDKFFFEDLGIQNIIVENSETVKAIQKLIV
jgi:CPA2 family monovalent cation:H+ antiporter-2